MTDSDSPFASPVSNVWVATIESEGIFYETFKSRGEAVRRTERYTSSGLRVAIARYSADESTFKLLGKTDA